MRRASAVGTARHIPHAVAAGIAVVRLGSMEPTATVILNVALDDAEDEERFLAWWDDVRRLLGTRFHLTGARLWVRERGSFFGMFDFHLPGVWALVERDQRWFDLEARRPPSKIALVEARCLRRESQASTLTTRELESWLQERSEGRLDFLLVNVLGREAFSHQHIAGSVNLPAREISDATARALVGPDLDRPVVVYCADYGCGASTLAAQRLTELGYGNIREYPGGMAEWAQWRASTVEGSGAGSHAQP